MNKECKTGRWDLSSLAPNHKSDLFKEKLLRIEAKVSALRNKESLLRNDIKSEEFGNILDLYEEISTEISKISHYAHLLFASDTSSSEARSLVAKIDVLEATTVNKMLFFNLWWKKKIDEKNAKRLIDKAGILKRYLIRQRELAKYTLSESEEKIINIKDTTGSNFIRRFYDQYVQRFTFFITLKGKRKNLSQPELIALFRSPDPKERVRAYKTLLNVYRKNEDVLGELYRSIVMDWRNEAIDLRGYRSPLEVRNILNDVSYESVATLLSVCRKNRIIFQDYFKKKAEMLRMKKISRYHIYAPIDTKQKKIQFEEGIKIVLDALEEFSPRIAQLAEMVLKENHLDSELRKGKKSGAFCATASPKIIPFVLVNFTGEQNDIFTLAHELGHAVHSLLASDKSILVQAAPLPLAELASVFTEMIILEKLLETSSNSQKKTLIANQLDDIYATVMRQAYFTLFEKEAHEGIYDGFTMNQISYIYKNNLREQFGNAVLIPEIFKYEWTYVPHFFHTPFYTYAYSFGNLLTISLYKRYKEERDFLDTYTRILAAGGSRKPEVLLEEAGIDIRSCEFWQSGFDYIKQRVEFLKKS